VARKFSLTIVNNTAESVTVSAGKVLTSEWGKNVTVPASKLNGVAVAARGGITVELSVDDSAKKANFTVVMQMKSGDKQTIYLDAANAFRTHVTRRLYLKPAVNASRPAAKYLGFLCQGYTTAPYAPGPAQILIALGRPVSKTGWMSALSPDLSLHQINIPGTHDSGTFNPSTLAKIFAVRTQTMTISEQLYAGIRWFDIRLRLDGTDLRVHHNAAELWNRADKYDSAKDNQPLTLSSILDEIKAFLTKYPDETIITCVNREWVTGEKDPTNSELLALNNKINEVFEAHKPPKGLYRGSTLPTLGTVRGQVVILRRYSRATVPANTPPQLFWGLVANVGWPDTKPPDDGVKQFTCEGTKYYVEDKYQPDTPLIPSKVDYAEKALEAAQRPPLADYWPLIFTSAAGDYPWGLAAGGDSAINPMIFRYLITRTAGRYGTIIMDYPEEPAKGALIDLILTMNVF
jgi:1-phosphatidylinositol phosphodiesterase